MNHLLRTYRMLWLCSVGGLVCGLWFYSLQTWAQSPSRLLFPGRTESSPCSTSRPAHRTQPALDARLCRDVRLSVALATSLPSTTRPYTSKSRTPRFVSPQSVAISNNGRYLVAGWGGGRDFSHKKHPITGKSEYTAKDTGRVVAWDLQSNTIIADIPTFGDVLKVAISPHGRYLAYIRIYTPGDSVRSDRLFVLDIRTGQEVTFGALHRHLWWSPRAFVMSQEGDHILFSAQWSWHVLHLAENKMTELPIVATGATKDVVTSADQKTIAFLQGNSSHAQITVCRGTQPWMLWKNRVPKLVLNTGASSFDFACISVSSVLFDGHSLAFSPDGKGFLVSDRWGKVSWLNVSTLKTHRTFQAPGTLPQRVSFSPDQRLVAGLTQARRWVTWRYDKTQPSGFSYHYQQNAAFSSLSLWDTATGEKKACLHLHDCFLHTFYARFRGTTGREEEPARFAFSPDNQSVYVGCQGLFQIDLRSFQIVRVFHRPR